MNLIERAEKLPVGVIATAVGLATLSNAYQALGFYSVRYVTMTLMIVVWCAAAIKLTKHHKTFWKEYQNVVPASLYATFTMLTMILGSFVLPFARPLGQGIWLFGLILHIIHLCVFSYRNIIKGVKRDTFLPSWFVSYAGVMVSVVVGVPMGMPQVLQGMMTYALIMYPILFPCMVFRVAKYPIPPQFGMTRAIFLAPTSLVLVSFLNVHGNDANQTVVFTLYSILFVTIFYVSTKIPEFIGKPFNPAGQAAMTFPSAIALVATFRVVGFLNHNGFYTASMWLNRFFGIQLWVTTAIMAYVAFNYLQLYSRSLKPPVEEVKAS